MNENPNALLGILASLTVILGGMIGGIVGMMKQSARMARIEDRVGIMWTFVMRGAMGKAVNDGFGEVRSPFRAHPEAHSYFDGLAAELKAFYAAQPHGNDLAFALKVQEAFGDRLFKEVCLKHRQIDPGTALILATAVAKGDGVDFQKTPNKV